MNQDLFKRRNLVVQTREPIGCRRWLLFSFVLLLTPIILFIFSLFWRWVVIPWSDQLVVNSHRNLVDRSFISGKPCMAPCWYGINLGKSSTSTVYETLAELPFVYQNDIREWGTTWGNDDQAREIFYYCSYLPKQSCGGITLSGGKVVRIWTQIDYSLTLESIVERIGSPDYSAMFPGIEFQHCLVVLVWIDDEAVISASNQRNPGCPSKTGIEADMQVDMLTYYLEYDLGFYDRYDNYQKWRGFANP